MSHSGLIKRPSDIDVRRPLHVKLLPDTHAALRMMCIQRGLSIQELVEEACQLAVSEDPRMKRIIDELVERKKERYFKQLSATDAESLFSQIELEREALWRK